MSRYDEALAAYDQAIRRDPYDVFLCKDKAELLVQTGRDEDALVSYEEANADYRDAEPRAPQLWYAIMCLLGKVDLREVAEAKTRLQEAGKELSHEAIEAEMRLMHLRDGIELPARLQSREEVP